MSAQTPAMPRPSTPPAAAAGLLHAARQTLTDAAWTTDPAQRYALAHLAALRAAAAVLASRTHADRRSRRPASAWDLLGRVAPELGEWSSFFAAGARKRAAAEAGLAAATAREADDLVRESEAFLALVERGLGLAA